MAGAAAVAVDVSDFPLATVVVWLIENDAGAEVGYFHLYPCDRRYNIQYGSVDKILVGT